MADDPMDPNDIDTGSGAASGDEGEGPSGADTKADQAPSETTKPAGATKPTGATKPVVRKKVVSRRVTPKGGPVNTKGGRPAKGATKGSTAAHAHAADGDDADLSDRYTPPTAKYAEGPSPTWVPVLMFALLGLGGLLIVLNYGGVFGDADNMRLIIGLVLILGGIITATNLR